MKANVDYIVVDVRDDDFANGNIKDAVNIPAHEIAEDPLALKPLLVTPKRVVFHCALSQVRGPKSANAYLRSCVLFDSETSDAASKQEVYVLEGGFSQWSGLYGTDNSLTENYNKKFWESGGY
ncbi:hypothetical protein HK100_001014 [Physocladia obscura]|uniref:Rhodanese domain-containing protein n=1 Tax=Physocladia obscura TaxID=109957 RepID=A0AAD5SZ85_9FUNG|nr:hypothetical protein HK100_001014 [Physocladia obscura]